MRLVLRTYSGRLSDGETINYYLDAKLSRFVFIDGQTLDPSSFGQRFRSMGNKDGFRDCGAYRMGLVQITSCWNSTTTAARLTLGNDSSTKELTIIRLFSLSTSDRSINY